MNAFRLLIVLLLFPVHALAGVCDISWDGDKLAANSRGRPLAAVMRLLDKNKNVNAELTVAQIQAFYEAKEAIAREAGRSPTFVVCDGQAPNAFAAKGNNGDVLGVTVGMMKLANGDRDMAASVIGHEFAHHIQNHMSSGQQRDMVLGILGLIAGAALENKLQTRTGVQGLGFDLGRVGATLVSRKFSRDQEREADEFGFKYLVSAGFNPNGAIRLATRMQHVGAGGAGLFFDSHPGWEERSERFRSLIAGDPNAQRIIASTGTATTLSAVQGAAAPAQIALAPTYETTDAQKSYTEGLAALRRNDVVAGVRDIRSAAAAGYGPAQTIAGSLHLMGRGGVEKNEVEAVRYFKLAAEQGDPQGMNSLGAMYMRGGGGLEKDEAEGIRLYRLAADEGNANAIKNIGDLYNVGRGEIAKDQVEALKWYQRAAELGHGDAINALGIYYQNGLGGVSKDEVEAVRQYRLSADKRSAWGQYNLGLAYRRGIGEVAKDDAEAVKLFRLSANQGNAWAQNELGIMYMQGLGGLQKNDVEAARLYKLAADQGHTSAQTNLGAFYLTGRGGLYKDDSAALRLFRLSAERNNASGQSMLAFMYENGRGGVPKDLDTAILWYQKAAAQNNQFAANKLKTLNR